MFTRRTPDIDMHWHDRLVVLEAASIYFVPRFHIARTGELILTKGDTDGSDDPTPSASFVKGLNLYIRKLVYRLQSMLKKVLVQQANCISVI